VSYFQGGVLSESMCFLLSVRVGVETEAVERDRVGSIPCLCVSLAELCLFLSVDGVNNDLMSLVSVMVCDAQA